MANASYADPAAAAHPPPIIRRAVVKAVRPCRPGVCFDFQQNQHDDLTLSLAGKRGLLPLP